MRFWLRPLFMVVAFLFVLTLVSGDSQDEDYILLSPRSVQGDGTYENSLQLLIDGRFVDEQSAWDSEQCVFWQDQDTYFVIDLGAEFLIVDILVQVDDNDDYLIEYSLEGSQFIPLFVFYEGYGDTGDGMDTMSSNPGDPNFASLPERKRVRARFLRLSASSGDGSYALAEVQAYGYPTESEEEPFSGALITPQGVTGFGNFTNEAALLIDEYVPPEGSEWDGPGCVSWSELDTHFVIDLGQVYEVTGLTIQVSAQDSYRIDYSSDDQEYFNLLDVNSTAGEFGDGMDTVSNLTSDTDYSPDLDFFPVTARYIRISATAGDGTFAVSEISIFGNFID
ncbi:MAG: hypothetical protein GQ544_01495 [Candidatus Aminicenantes bacterium]|nr:hypothetical protein [Candidatus Aminicenantes bacterium]